MNSAKDLAIKLIDEMPESNVNEVIDFLLFIKNKSDQELILEPDEEEEIRKSLTTEERIPAETVKKMLFNK